MKQQKLWLKWLFCIIPASIALLMYFILPHFPQFTEYVITRVIFRAVTFPIEWIVSFLPFSLTETVVVLCLPVILSLLTVWVIRIIRSSKKIRTVEKGVRFTAWCLSLALFIFMLTDGANFSRLTVSELLKLPQKQYTAQELYILTSDLATKASAAREKLKEDENGYTKLSVSQSELLLKADDCYDALKEEYPFLVTGVWRVKPVILSRAWSYTGYTGVYCPWLMETSINVDVPDCDLGHTAAHEIAHTMGFAKENECNFLSWLACSKSGQPDYEYSGHLQAFIYCSNALYDADRELWKKSYQNCSDGVLRDLKQRNEYWKQFQGEVMESSQNFNDTFIKVNGVESGVLSYNEMVELMLKYYDKNNMLK